VLLLILSSLVLPKVTKLTNLLGATSQLLLTGKCIVITSSRSGPKIYLRAVITGKESKYNAIADLRNTTIGISRLGSGSQTMAYVMGFQQGWSTEDMKFKSQ